MKRLYIWVLLWGFVLSVARGAEAETASGTFNATIDVFGNRAIAINWSGSWNDGIFSASMTMTQDSIGDGSWVSGHMQIASSNPAQSRALTVTSPTGGAPTANGSWTITGLPIVVSMWVQNTNNGTVTQQQVVAEFDGVVNPGEGCVMTPFTFYADNRFGTAPLRCRVAVVTIADGTVISSAQDHTDAVGFHHKYEGSLLVCPGQEIILQRYDGAGWVPYSPPAGDPQPNPTNEKRITITIPANNSGVTITYKLMKTLGGVTSMHSQFVQAPGGSAVIQTILVPNDGATYEVVSRIEGYEFTDGQWVVAEGAVKEQSVSPPTSADDLPDADAPPSQTGPISATTPTEAPSSGPATATSGGTVWRSGGAAADALTNAVYREGVDKITIAIEGSPVVAKSFDSAPQPEHVTSVQAAPVVALVTKLPTAPVVTEPGSESQFSVTFPIPGLAQPKTIAVDFADYSVSIAIFKTVVRAALSLWFFFLSVRAIREAFAG